ncbi:hypothetical protein HU200_013669 [Digitaria exilis]|uniref:F-box domain-containing protein n=1 Tax=Digitaria exilis TaxID=1010633 RepID=A0A835FCP6_9POAL|nr:hypothetical protein HU200_013669 [Digitaria exilis]
MPPQLPDDVVEEILARFPPDEPAHLVRAALACKAWHRIVSGAGFRRRLHGRAPSLLGFFHHHGSHPAYFNPTSPFRPTYAARAGWLILNGRHGRFLVRKMTTTSPFTPPSMEDAELIVWDPPLTSSTECPCRPSSVVFIWEDYWSLFTIDLRSNIAKKVGHVSYTDLRSNRRAMKHCGKPLQVRRQEQVPEVLAKLEVLLCDQYLGQGEFDSS